METPSIEQLRVLVDRAERSRLTGAEARMLRAGVEALAAAVRPGPVPEVPADQPAALKPAQARTRPQEASK
ncbi:MAG: hypothetical protein JO362_06070 [Streptomycetaceae bacterium]|nr:hypothetical protein [Streptomycetaceae bacterium]